MINQLSPTLDRKCMSCCATRLDNSTEKLRQLTAVRNQENSIIRSMVCNLIYSQTLFSNTLQNNKHVRELTVKRVCYQLNRLVYQSEMNN